MLTLLRRWLSGAPRPGRTSCSPSRRWPRLRLEPLEERAVPADGTFVAGLTGGATEAMIQVSDGFTNAPRYPFYIPFAGYRGPLSVGSGDINRDGIGDVIVAATAPLTMGHIKAFDGETRDLLFSILAFQGFNGTVSAAGGDVNGDGVADLIIAANNANGHVKAFSGVNGSLIASFLAFPNYLGQVSVAAADFNNNGTAEIILGAGGAGVNGRIALFNANGSVFNIGFFAFPFFDGPINVSAGDINGDGFPDIIVGAGAAPGGHVKAFNGFPGAVFSQLVSFFSYEVSYIGGVNVGVADVNRDFRFEIRTAPVGGRLTEVRTFDGLSGALLGTFVAAPNNNGASIAGNPE
jgi:hypothetical protein